MKWVFYVLVFLYMCNRSAYGIKQKEIHTLDIEPIKYGSEGNYIKVGETKKINCKGSTTKQKLEWYDPNGNLVPQKVKRGSKHVYVEESYGSPHRHGYVRGLVLDFERAMVSDSGVWECRSGQLSENISICIIDPADIGNTATEVTIDLGRSITLSCHVQGGDPQPTIFWHRNGEDLDDNESTKYEMMTSFKSQWLEGLLTIFNVDLEDQGTYICRSFQENSLADDCVTASTINVTLNINHKPFFDKEMHYYYAKYNESVDLVCNAKGYPTPTFQWAKVDDDFIDFFKKQVVVSADGTEATLSLIANDSTFGEKYVCRASNSFGDVDGQFMILKLQRPPKPSGLTVSNFTAHEIEFNVTWASDEIVPIESFIIQYLTKGVGGVPKEYQWRKAEVIEIDYTQETDDGAVKYITLPGLEEETEYWVRLRARNEIGESPWSVAVLASTDAEPEIEGPDSLYTPTFNSAYYGIVFTAAIVIFAAICMFVIKKLN